MAQSYYNDKSLPELIRIAESNLKQLKTVNKSIEGLLNNLEMKVDDEKIRSLNKKWHAGFEILKTIAGLSANIESREAKDPQTKLSLEKMDILYSELRAKFEDKLQRIKDSNFLLSSEIQYKQGENGKKSSGELEQELLEDVEIQEIVEQREFVDERQQNLEELDKALTSIHNMGEHIYRITEEDGLKIDSILKLQKTHRDETQVRVNEEVARTIGVNENVCRKILFFGFIAVILAFCVIGVFYMTRHNY